MRYENDIISKKIEKTQKLKKVFFIILYIILIPTILFSLILIILELGNSEKFPSFLNIEIYTVISNSMEPKLKVNDIVIVKKEYSNEEFKVGNIISFRRRDGEIITHRIKEIIKSDFQNAYITKGDNNDVPDEDIVTYDMIIGKVIYTLSYLGTIIKILKSKLFFIMCIILLILIVWYDKRLTKRKIERKIVREKHEKKSDFYF